MAKSGSLDQPFQLSTKRYFAGVGLNYYGYRFYASSTGRWTSRDSIGESGGINFYAFVLNNPINNIDLFGLFSNKMKCMIACNIALGYTCTIFGIGAGIATGGNIWIGLGVGILCRALAGDICYATCANDKERP